MQAHIPTMFMMVITVSIAMTACTAALWRRDRKEGLGYWTLALATHTLVYILYSLRDQLSDYLSIVLANILLVCVFALFAEGVMQFQQRRPNRWLIWLPVVIMPPVQLVLLDQLALRIAIVACITLYQSLLLLTLILVLRHQTIGRGQYYLAMAFLLISVTMAYRGIGVLVGMEQMLLLTSSNAIQTITFLVATISLILSGIGLILMTKERADAQLLKLAMHDELTGLPNRRYILEVLDKLLAGMQRSQQPLNLMMLDIDHFKQINDSHGHLSGDRVLQQLADTLRQRLRAQDHAGRLGGEEFLVILPNTGAAGASELAEQLRHAIATTAFTSRDGKRLSITISVGVCSVTPDSTMNIQQFISQADKALYRAKQNGRNRVEAASLQN